MNPGDVPVVPAPARRVTTVRNVRRIKIGIGMAVLALLIVVVGALIQVGAVGAQVLDPVARGDNGETVTFEAEARRYDLILNRTEVDLANVVDRNVGRTVCELTLADSTTATVRGSRQVIATDTDFGSSIGYFDAVAGTTSVRCDHDGSDGIVLGGYTVAESKQSLTIASLAMILAGVLLGIAATFVIVSGAKGKAVMVDVAGVHPVSDLG